MRPRSLNRQTLWCAAALAAVIAVLLGDSLFTGKGLVPADGLFRLPPWKGFFPLPVSNYLLSDQYLTFLPLRHFTSRHGIFSLWNPYLSCGAPSIGSMQAAPFYPINLLLGFLDPFRAAAPAAFLKLFVAGWFTWLFLRKLGASAVAALFGAVAFALSGFMIVWLGHPHVNSACFLPAVLYFLECALAANAPRVKRPLALAALSYGALVLGGHAPTIVHVSLWILAYALFRKCLPLAVLALLGGTLLAAPQLIPYVEYYQLGSTAQASRNTARWQTHLPPAALGHWIAPLISGSPARRFESLGAATGVAGNPNASFNERAGYVGVLSLFLAAIALLRRSSAPIHFFAASAGACLWIVLGLPPAPSLMRALPILDAINHTRLLLVVCFSLCALAAFGLDELTRLNARQARLALIALGAAAALFLGWLWAVFAPYWPELTQAEKDFFLRQLPVFLAATTAAAAAVLYRKKPLTGALCVAWTCLELLFYGIGYNPALSRSLYYPTTKALEFLQRDGSRFRVLGLGWVLPPDSGIVYGLHDARGQDYTTVRRYEELISGAAGDYFFYSNAEALPASFAALGVKYVLAPNGWTAPSPEFRRVYRDEISIYRAPGSGERAELFFDWKKVAPQEALERVRERGLSGRKTLLLEEVPDIPPGPPLKNASAEIRFLSDGTDEVRLRVDSPRPALLLLRDTYFPGWTARVDERAAPIYRADYNFRAVAVPAGVSEVAFSYKPASARTGLALGLAALGALLLLVFA